MLPLTHLGHPLRRARPGSGWRDETDGTAAHPIVGQVCAEMTASAWLSDETWQELIRHMNVLGEDDLRAVLQALAPWLAAGLPDEQPVAS
jgi:hypothetical protein